MTMTTVSYPVALAVPLIAESKMKTPNQMCHRFRWNENLKNKRRAPLLSTLSLQNAKCAMCIASCKSIFILTAAISQAAAIRWMHYIFQMDCALNVAREMPTQCARKRIGDDGNKSYRRSMQMEMGPVEAVSPPWANNEHLCHFICRVATTANIPSAFSYAIFCSSLDACVGVGHSQSCSTGLSNSRIKIISSWISGDTCITIE